MNSFVKKICLLGSEGVGKTSLIRRFVDNSFDDQYRSTIGVQISQKDVTIDENNMLKLIIWDLEGLDVSNDYPMTYLTGAAALILVSDIARPDTTSQLMRISEKLAKTEAFNIPTCIALNKADLLTEDEQKLNYTNLKNSEYLKPETEAYLTSAKEGGNVESVFNFISSQLWSAYK